jgi:hypothetical protein
MLLGVHLLRYKVTEVVAAGITQVGRGYLVVHEHMLGEVILLLYVQSVNYSRDVRILSLEVAEHHLLLHRVQLRDIILFLSVDRIFVESLGWL